MFIVIKKNAFLGLGCVVLFFLAQRLFAEEMSSSLEVGGAKYTLTLEPRDASCHKNQQIQLGKIFCMTAVLKPVNDTPVSGLELKSFEAVMPEHRHGMVTRARVKDAKAGEYLIEGLKLHMPGEWRFDLKFVRGKEAAQVAIPLKL